MPRQARKKSENRIYHVMLRGINQQQIFEDAEDRSKFLDTLQEYKEICRYELLAYCLMGNHIHLLIRENGDSLETIFKRICGRFVYWYNIKYQRVGHLFQDRFKSEPVDSEEYFFTVLRYIHQNPIKAGLCRRIEDYAYSSYLEYLNAGSLVDTEYVLHQISVEEFIHLHRQEVDANCMDISDQHIRRVTDEQAKVLIKKIAKCENVAQFQSLDIKIRDKYLKKLRGKGISIRQLSRLTGTSISVIRKIG